MNYHKKMNISPEILIDIVCPMMKNMIDIIKLSMTCSTLLIAQDEMIKKATEKHPFLKKYSHFLTNTLKISCSVMEFSKIINTLENNPKEKEINLHFLTNINQNKSQYKTSIKLYMIIQKYAKHLERTTLYNSNILKFLLSMQYMFKKLHPAICNISDALFADAFLVKNIVSIEKLDFDIFELYENISILKKQCPKRYYTLYENVMKNKPKIVRNIGYQIETIRIFSQLHKHTLDSKIHNYINYEMFKYLNKILYSSDVAYSTIFNHESISQKFASISYNNMLKYKNKIVVDENVFPRYLYKVILTEFQLFEKQIKIYI